jgi:hypothetical protein
MSASLPRSGGGQPWREGGERSAAGGRDSVPTVVRRSNAPEHVNQPEPTAAQAVGSDLACGMGDFGRKSWGWKKKS